MRNTILFSIFTVFVSISYGHGENKPGPNGGFIRMPGAYHTELIPNEINSLKVYLLDIQFKNPSVKDSSIEMSLGGKSKINTKCEPQENFFICKFPEKVDLTKKGSLKVISNREGQKGMVVTYPLPLRLEKSEAAEKSKDDHSGHH